ncbi:response regulator [Pseudomonas sp. SWRI59]|uniref:PAS domain-containing sensor histidine kinase n=1 Tax=unclassified Pseudomonas TaxID=196821 RepID=UPI0016444E4F|nr:MULTISPECIES: PAS domain-containing sensor histidine kinase [unclassified Pseudomonas]MBC3501980.1 response regulator [Pseudomonas sp. SWRI59]MBC3506988.1 response regulator [Pseudomonas sp. SWRI68]
MPPVTQPSYQQLQARVAELEALLSEREDIAQANNKLLGQLVDSSLANVFAADRKMRLVAINRTARETFQRLRGFVPQIGDYIPQFLANQPDIMGRLAPVWPRLLAGEAFIDTISLGPPDDLRHYEIRYNPLRDEQQRIQGGYMFAYDITERVAEQGRLRQTEEALRQSQKMEAVGQLTGGIAHDFNNLLGSMLGALELAEQRLGQQRYFDTARMLDVGKHNALRAASLVQRLLAFSRQQTLLAQPVDVQLLVADMNDLIRSSIDSHIDFQDLTQAGLWSICIDPQQLENALLNLCINARDAMPLGGTLRIGCENTELDKDQASRMDLPSGQFLHIRVDDTGIGMSKDIMQRALDPFFTTKPMGQGTGLGLSMVYGFVRQSGGQLRIDSTPGQGTTVHLYLPRDESITPPAPCVAPEEILEKPQHRPYRIMLVEDQATMRLVLSEVLQELGHEVQVCEDGLSAFNALREGPLPDLLITDVGLPGGIDGQQLAGAYRSLASEAPVILITGYDITSSVASSLPAGPTEVLCKPFELKALAQRIDRLLGVDAHLR